MKKRILCFGDSNTWGSIPGGTERFPADVRWTGVLRRELGEEYEVIEEGYNGRTTVFDDPVEGRLSGLRYFGPCLDSQSPLDLVILMLGTNDLKLRFGVDAGMSAFGLHRYLDALRVTPMAGERPRLLLAAPIRIDPSYRDSTLFLDMFGERAAERSEAFAPAYRAFAQEAGVAFLDAAEFARANPADGIHMAAPDHERLGKAFAAKVRELLG